MQTTTRTTRLIAAVAAVSATLTLFSAVTSLAGPERNVLMAKIERSEQLAAAQGRGRAMAVAPHGLVVAAAERR